MSVSIASHHPSRHQSTAPVTAGRTAGARAPEESLKYNWTTNEFDWAPKGAKLRLNVGTGDLEYAGTGEKLRYNWMSSEMEFAPKGASASHDILAGRAYLKS